MIRILGTIFAGLLGLAFGSFLNVCLSRWPEGESVVRPRSHCRNCHRTLAWWENIPVASWLVLWGRCRTCETPISPRYPLVELAIAALWAFYAWRSIPAVPDVSLSTGAVLLALAIGLAQMILLWTLVALAFLDAENLWLPDALTLPGILLSLTVVVVRGTSIDPSQPISAAPRPLHTLLAALTAAAAGALLILLIRWSYWLLRRREGIGLGDAKLMALLAAWLGLPGALLAFGIGVVLGALAGLTLLAAPASRRDGNEWAASKLPLGTFLCIGGILSALWGPQVIAVYRRWAGF